MTSDSTSGDVQAAKPNQAPAANAPEAVNDGISTYAEGGASRIYWGSYFDVTVYCVDEDGAVISLGELIPQEISLTNNNTLTFADWAVGSYKTDTDVYTYKEARMDNAGGSVVTSLRASSETDWLGNHYYYYNFYNGSSQQRSLTYLDRWIGGDSGTQTANLYLIYTRTEKEAEQEGDLYIEETVADDGRFTARFQDTVSIPDDAVITYTWQRSLNGTSDWIPVERIAVSGSEGNYIYNMAENGVYVDVVQDASPNAANVQDDERYWYKVTATVTTGDSTQTYEADPVQVPYYIELQNGSFESPAGHKQYEMGVEGLIWKTTGPGSLQNKPGQDIEIIRPSGNSQTVQNYGVPVASEGEQFAELNCEAVGTLYQDVMTIPGTTLNWQFDHVARQRRGQDGTWDAPDLWDEMAMVIMPAENADYWAKELKNAGSTANAIRRVLQRIENEESGAYVLDNVRDKPYYRDNDNTSNVRGWGHYDSENGGTPYTVPEDQYLTRFFFVSVSSGMGSISLGNCLDNVYFSKDPLPLENTESRVTVTKKVTGLDAIPQDYSVTFQIGERTETLAAADFTRQGQTFTASVDFTYTELSPNSSQKLTVTETGGAVENYQQATSYQVTGGETTLTGEAVTTQQFDLPAGQSRSVTFTNTYTPTTTTVTIHKVITGLEDEPQKLAALVSALTFTLTDTENPSASYSAMLEDVTPGEGGTYTVTIEDVVPGTYTVTESGQNVDGYAVTTTGLEKDVTVTLDGNNTVNITNAYTRDNNDLTIKKEVYCDGSDSVRNAVADAANNTTFTFIVTAGAGVDTAKLANNAEFTVEGGTQNTVNFIEVNGVYSARVSVTGANSLTIRGLPVGTYTVSEDTTAIENGFPEAYFDEYNFIGSSSTVTLTADDAGNVKVTNIYETYKTVTIEKKVTESMGSKNDWFKFSFNVTDKNGNDVTPDVMEKITISSTDAEVDGKINKAAKTFELRGDKSVTFGNLKGEYKITVTETDKGTGYTLLGPTFESDNLNDEMIGKCFDGSGGIARITIPESGTYEDVGTVTFTNQRKAVAPTGLESDHTAPFALMVGAAFLAGAALLGSVVARRRRRWQG